MPSKVTKPQRFILFTLGEIYIALENRFKGRPFSVSLSKTEFIGIVQRAGIIAKQARSIYQNLQDLEKRSLITYLNNDLSLTPKGHQLMEKLRKEITPFLAVKEVVKSDFLVNATRVRTRLNT